MNAPLDGGNDATGYDTDRAAARAADRDPYGPDRLICTDHAVRRAMTRFGAPTVELAEEFLRRQARLARITWKARGGAVGHIGPEAIVVVHPNGLRWTDGARVDVILTCRALTSQQERDKQRYRRAWQLDRRARGRRIRPHAVKPQQVREE